MCDDVLNDRFVLCASCSNIPKKGGIDTSWLESHVSRARRGKLWFSKTCQKRYEEAGHQLRWQPLDSLAPRSSAWPVSGACSPNG